jgi:hypothetical protein
MDARDRELNQMLNGMSVVGLDNRQKAMAEYIDYIAEQAEQLFEHAPPMSHDFVSLGHCKQCLLIAISRTKAKDFD